MSTLTSERIARERARLAVRCFIHAKAAREIAIERELLDATEAYLREESVRVERLIRELDWVEEQINGS